MMLQNVRIVGKWLLCRGIVENDVLAGAQDIVEHRYRQRSRSHALVAELHRDNIATGRSLCCDALVGPSGQDQQSAFRAGLFNRGAHECVE